ncbi:MAG: hypothetical protein BA864_15435 [Desulfuromonadales bacterium C00003093]|nr:MAG: hypothetical protein BA864_15435 [Desulfuromonadales bacterium C00003093]
MESQKERLNVQGAAALPGEIYSFVQNAASHSTCNVLSAEKHGAIIMEKIVSFVPHAERE